jgi:two-component system, chemotaxis family, sensor kinase Cph1
MNYAEMSQAELIERLQALESQQLRGSHTAWHETEERMRAILETAVEGIITIDERGTIESLNPAAERLFGYDATQLIGKNVKLLMPSPYREEHDGYLTNYLQTGHKKIIGIGREVVGQRKDGSVFPMELSVSEIRLADRRLFTGFVRDITARKESEHRIEGMLKEVTDIKAALDAHSIVAITDPQGRITYANDKFCEISKYSREELLGQDHRIINSGYHSKEFFKNLWTTIARGQVWKGEIRNRAKDGTIYWVDTTIFPFLSADGKPTQYIAIRTDITERKRDEERLAELARNLAEKNKELETIVYVASHDLRSPLVNIQGFSKELERTCEHMRTKLNEGDGTTIAKAELRLLLEQDVPEAIEYIMAGVLKIDALLAGFLRFSRLGRAALKIEPLNMNAMLAGIQQAMEFQIKQTGATVRVSHLPPCLGDATQINQVFSNLLDNALKYLDRSRPGLVQISGTVENDLAIYTIEDNGIGIAPEHQGKIFEIFHRLDPAHGEGEGLGLTIAQRILERQNGKIRVESEPGRGSRFFVSLPAK